MVRYVHTNIIAKDCNKLINFYKQVLDCKSIGQIRDIKGEWLDTMTGIKNAHIIGEHLALPGAIDGLPTLEIFSYDNMIDEGIHKVNQTGLAHIAFEVDDVKGTLDKIIIAGGSKLGDICNAEYPNGMKATFVYARDIEGNIIELQTWSK